MWASSPCTSWARFRIAWRHLQARAEPMNFAPPWALACFASEWKMKLSLLRGIEERTLQTSSAKVTSVFVAWHANSFVPWRMMAVRTRAFLGGRRRRERSSRSRPFLRPANLSTVWSSEGFGSCSMSSASHRLRTCCLRSALSCSRLYCLEGSAKALGSLRAMIPLSTSSIWTRHRIPSSIRYEAPSHPNMYFRAGGRAFPCLPSSMLLASSFASSSSTPPVRSISLFGCRRLETLILPRVEDSSFGVPSGFRGVLLLDLNLSSEAAWAVKIPRRDWYTW
mmetsp:Transcript_9390/g.23119  ORF Transcript_9390/g.23119 Transcript_9390/m.23119 type:complete len:280 (+) Transcript_9390:756-1595(+)